MLYCRWIFGHVLMIECGWVAVPGTDARYRRLNLLKTHSILLPFIGRRIF